MYDIHIIWRWIEYEYCENDGRFHDKGDLTENLKKYWNVPKLAQEIYKLNILINKNWTENITSLMIYMKEP
jgi:hypothetical protein